MKILHTADIHLGAKLLKLGLKSEQQRVQIQKTFEKIVDIALEEKVDVFLIAGDVFDTINPERYLTDFLYSNLKRLNERHIYTFISFGTHDYINDNGGSKSLDFSELSYIKVFNDSKVNNYIVEDLSLKVFCNPLLSNKTSENPFANIKRDTNYKYNIAMAHGSLQIPGKSSKNDAPFTAEDIDNTGMDYIALGHWHNQQRLNTSVEAWYAGAPEMVNTDQINSGRILIVNISDANEVKVTPMDVGKRKFDALDINIHLVENFEDLLRKIKENADENLIRIVNIFGSYSDSFGILDIEEIGKRLNEYFFDLIIKNTATYIVGDDGITSDSLVKMKFVEKLATYNAPQEVLDDALRLGLMLIDGRSKLD